MKLSPPTASHFKPLHDSQRPGPQKQTHLSPKDLSGIITRSAKPQAAGGSASADPHARLTEQAQKWVAQTFFGTLMKQMHDSPFKSQLFEGGRGGEAFSSLYDQKLIEHMSRGVGNKLVNSIVKKIEAGAAYQKQKRSDTVQPIDQKGAAQSETQLPPRHRGAADADSNPYKHVRINVAPAA